MVFSPVTGSGAPDKAGREAEPDASAELSALSVPPGSRVLVLGPYDDALVTLLKSRRCRVWTLTAGAAGEVGETTGRTAKVDNLDDADPGDAFPDDVFDAVVLPGVLERIDRPGQLLRRVVPALGPGGRVIASVRNVTFVATRLQLLQGRLLLDDDADPDSRPVRYFDRAELRGTFDDADLAVIECLRAGGPAAGAAGPGTLPEEAIAALRADEDAATYEFVVVATPDEPDRAQPASVAEALQHQLESALEALEEARAGTAEQLETLDRELSHARADLALKDDFVLELRSAATRAEEESERLRSSAAEETEARDELERALAEARASLASTRASLLDSSARLAEVEAELEAVTSRTGYRLLLRLEVLGRRHPLVARLTARLVRLVTTRR